MPSCPHLQGHAEHLAGAQVFSADDVSVNVTPHDVEIGEDFSTTFTSTP